MLAVIIEVVWPEPFLGTDVFSSRRSQSDSLPRNFVSSEVPGCLRELGWTCSLRSSEEAELLARGICARSAAKGNTESSSHTQAIKCRVRSVNFTSCPKCASHRSTANVRWMRTGVPVLSACLTLSSSHMSLGVKSHGGLLTGCH
jgi:hypothetical protein